MSESERIDRRRAALIAYDVCRRALAPSDLARRVAMRPVLEAWVQMIAAARAASVPVIYTTPVSRADGADVVMLSTDLSAETGVPPLTNAVEGTAEAGFPDEIAPRPEDYIFLKRRPSAFYGTGVAELLHMLRRDTIIIGKGWYELNDGRQDLDWLRRYYPEDSLLDGADPPSAPPAAAPACAVTAMPETPILETGASPIAKSRRQKICLAMLVRNEVSIITRCLASVRPLIDYWVVVDASSTDGTPDIARNALSDIPGEFHQRPWVDFAYNHTEALSLAQEHGDYTLMIDSDEVVELPPGFRMPHLNADSYVIVTGEQERLWRPQIVRNGLPWRYEGVLHEFLSCRAEPEGGRVMPHERSQKRLPGARIQMGNGSARGSGNYRQEADLIELLAAETDSFLVARYKFYLAPTHLDAGDKEKALAAYRERATLGLWDQEVFISLYRSAGIEADLGFDGDAVIASYLLAHAARKDRAEALHGAARFRRLKERYQQGFELANRGLLVRRPDNAFFREDWIYEYGLLDEYAINAYWIGHYDECLKSCRKILGTATLADADRKRIQANAEFASQKLSGG